MPPGLQSPSDRRWRDLVANRRGASCPLFTVELCSRPTLEGGTWTDWQFSSQAVTIGDDTTVSVTLTITFTKTKVDPGDTGIENEELPGIGGDSAGVAAAPIGAGLLLLDAAAIMIACRRRGARMRDERGRCARASSSHAAVTQMPEGSDFLPLKAPPAFTGWRAGEAPLRLLQRQAQAPFGRYCVKHSVQVP